MNPVIEKLEELPVELRAIIENDEIVQIIDQIGDNFDIPYLWRGELVRATVRILSGLMKPNEFVPFIMDEYNLEQDEALSIALAINERIFSSVKPQLASLHNIEDNKLAHKIKVPHKPRVIVEEIPSVFVEKPVTSTNIYNRVDGAYQPETIKESPAITQVDNTPKVPIFDPEIPKQPQIESALTNKLDSLRVDKYREQF